MANLFRMVGIKSLKQVSGQYQAERWGRKFDVDGVLRMLHWRTGTVCCVWMARAVYSIVFWLILYRTTVDDIHQWRILVETLKIKQNGNNGLIYWVAPSSSGVVGALGSCDDNWQESWLGHNHHPCVLLIMMAVVIQSVRLFQYHKADSIHQYDHLDADKRNAV
jgi:hypothetical protein